MELHEILVMDRESFDICCHLVQSSSCSCITSSMVILALQLSTAIKAYFHVPVVLTKQHRVCQYPQALPCGVDKAKNEISRFGMLPYMQVGMQSSSHLSILNDV